MYEYQLRGTVSGDHRSFMRFVVNSAYGTGTATPRDGRLHGVSGRCQSVCQTALACLAQQSIDALHRWVNERGTGLAQVSSYCHGSHCTTDIIRNRTSDIRNRTSDIWNRTSDIRNRTSDIRNCTSLRYGNIGVYIQ